MRSGGRCVKGLFLSFVFTLFFSQAHATDVPPGNIAVDEVWALADSPFIVASDVSINTGVVLTIEAGVVVKFGLNTALTVNGTIIVRGTANSRITFTSNNPGELWKHINFTVSSVDAVYDGTTGGYLSGSIIEYATIENAGNQASPTTDGAIQLFDAHPYLNQLIVQNNNASGIYGVALSSVLKISDSVISTNNSSLGGGGISLDGVAGSQIEISGNTIQNNNTSLEGGGIRVIGVDVLSFDNNIVSGNLADADGGGIYINNLQGNSAQNFIKNNTINNNIANADDTGANGGGGVWVDASDISIINNTIADNDAEEGGGVVLGQSLTASTIISKNLIMGNSAVINGGGMHIDNGFHTVSENVVYNNSASHPTSGHAGGIDVHEGSIAITNNIIASNSSYKWFLNLPGVVTFDNNSIVDNYIIKQSTGGTPAPGIILTQAASMQQNTISGNDAKAESFIAFLNPTVATNMSNNNFLNNTAAVLVNNPFAMNVMAQGVWWGTTDPVAISSLVVGTVDVSAPAGAPRIDTPISSPTGVSAIAGNGEITVNWDANPEADVAGYKVYWGNQTVPDIENVQDVGNVTSFIISAVTSGVYFIAVTANDGATSVDDVTTLVNEDQTAGTESWFSPIQQVSFAEADLAIAISSSASSVVVGGAVTYTLTVTNNGPNIANNVVVVSTLPNGVVFSSASTGCAEAAGIVTCNITALDSAISGNNASFDVTVNVPDTAGTAMFVTSVTAAEFDSDLTNNTVSIDTTVNAASNGGGGGGAFGPLLLISLGWLFGVLPVRRTSKA